MIQAYDTLLAQLRQAGSTPRKHVLDNKAEIEKNWTMELELDEL